MTGRKNYTVDYSSSNGVVKLAPQNASRTGLYIRNLGDSDVEVFFTNQSSNNFGDTGTYQSLILSPDQSLGMTNEKGEPIDIRANIFIESDTDATIECQAEEMGV